MSAQLSFDFDYDKEYHLMNEFKKLQESCERVRKGQFAKIGALTKALDETRYELDTLKAALCRCQETMTV